MTAPTHYLRVEGANLDHFLEDTQDLSTVRGAGLLLIEAVGFVKEILPGLCDAGNLECLSQGASIGLFAVSTKDARGLCDNVMARLAEDTQFKHMTFLVDATPINATSEAFHDDVHRLLAMNRTRQLGTPSLVLPPWNEDPRIVPDEVFDRMQPATEETYVPNDDGDEPKKVCISPSTLARRDHGRDQRRELYSALGVSTDNFFTDDLHTLSAGQAYGLCEGKVAVLYADGNKFSEIIRLHCTSPTLYTEFDRQVREKREGLLKAIITSTEDDERWWTRNRKGQRVRRLETLLWGGDELIWVVPAWLGWEMASQIFQVTASWSFSALPDKGPHISEELTHSVGIVFASHKAPIQRLVGLARNLAQLAKNTIKHGLKLDGKLHAFRGRSRNLLAYEVLESFDFASDDIERRWGRRLHDSGLPPGALLLPGVALGELQEKLRTLENSHFPQRQLHEQARNTFRGVGWHATIEDPDLKEFIAELTALASLLQPFPEKTLWLHLAQLWNYVARPPRIAAHSS